MIIIVCGLPGTGKSTFAEALAAAIGAPHLNTDRVRDALGRRGHYSPEAKVGIYEALLDETRKALASEEHVVVDGTFSKKELRDPFLALAREWNLKVQWIEITAPEEIVKRRVSQKRAYSEADFAVYQKVKAEYDSLPEDRLVLDSVSTPIDKMVARARKVIDRSG